jgi:hypothetical protein
MQLLAFMMMSLHCLSLHSMFDVENNKQTLWDIVIANSLSRDDYDTYRNVATLSRTHNKIIEDMHRPQKKLIEKYIEDNRPMDVTPIIGVRSWNKDFSQCAWVSWRNYRVKVADYKDLYLTLVGVVNNKVKSKVAYWRDFYFPIFEDDIRPFFDKDGKACFHGCGLWQTNFETSKAVIEYCIDLKGEYTNYRCWYLVPDPTEWADNYECFIKLLNFPLLMKVLLQSTFVERCVRSTFTEHGVYKENWKKYYARWATLSEDWMFFKQHVAFRQIENEEGISEDQSSLHKTHDSFSESLQLVIKELTMKKGNK